jgi:serine/threonine-protein kinase
VPDTGGQARTIAKADASKEYFTQPRLLSGGKHLLYVLAPLGATSEGQIIVQTLDGKDRRTLVNGGSDPHVLPSGQLVYIHDGTLLAAPFDNRRLTVTGGPVPVLEGVNEVPGIGTGQFSLSTQGALAYRPGPVGSAQRLMVWVNREGHEQPISARPLQYTNARISPDGRKIAVGAIDEEHDIWVYDLEKETLTRMTFGSNYEGYPLWTADSKFLFFGSSPQRPVPGAIVRFDIDRRAADGKGNLEALTQNMTAGYPSALMPDGKSLIFSDGTDLRILPLDPKGPARPLLAGAKSNQSNADFSPDGRWIAYDSSESGRMEVYVRPYPAMDSGRWQISSEGGSRPVWARSGRELFFLTANNRIAAVAVQPGSGFAYGKPQVLFDASPYFSLAFTRYFDVSPDGKRFLMEKSANVAPSSTERPSIVVISNWADEVKARMPAGK